MSTTVSVEVVNDVAILSLLPPVGKPPTLDQLNLGALERFLDSWSATAGEGAGNMQSVVSEEAGHRFSPRLLVIKSPTPKWFCAGADIAALETLSEQSVADWVKRGHRVFQKLAELPIPTVARVEGYALGGGLELALACDLIFSSENAFFGQTEAKLGFVPGWGGGYRLAERVGKAKAKELFFSARIVGAAEAQTIGLVDQVLAAEKLDSTIEEFAADVRGNSTCAITQFKAMSQNPGLDWKEGMDLEAKASEICIADPETKKRVHNFLNRKKSPSVQ